MALKALDHRGKLKQMHLKDDNKRQRHIIEAQEYSRRYPRFGLFSQLIPNCIGEDSYSRRAASLAELPNIRTNPNKKGRYGQALFSDPAYCSIFDSYRDPFRLQQQYLKSKVDQIPHEKPFKPAIMKTTLELPWWQYIPPNYQKEPIHTEKNFYTNPGKRGQGNSTVGHLFSHYSHSIDLYDSKKMKDIEDQMEAKKKILGNKPYCSTSNSQALFTPSYDICEEFSDGQQIMSSIKKQENKKIKTLKKLIDKRPPFHPASPPKQGYNKTFNRFPTYQENIPNFKKSNQEMALKQMIITPWKPNSFGTFSQPSIALTNMHIKK